jgi:hypothetical protein
MSVNSMPAMIRSADGIPDRTVPALLLTILLAGCLGGCAFEKEEQRRFENDAYSNPKNITITDAKGGVSSRDRDDWRISPLYVGLVRVDPAFPNPSTTLGRIEIHVMVDGLFAVNGLYALVHEPGISTRVVWSLDQSPLPPGLHVITLNPLDLSRLGTVEDARGLHRIVITDRRENVLTYGDVMVE